MSRRRTLRARHMNHTQPQFGAIALLTIDVQRDFLDEGSAAITGTSAIVPQLATVVRAFRRAALPVVHAVRIYLPNGSNADLCRRAAIESGARIVCPGTDGMELAAGLGVTTRTALDANRLLDGELLEVGAHEWVMYKPRWGAFFQTSLESHLRDLRVTTLVVGGCNFPNCPRTTIYEASERDFRVVLIEDAISGFYDRGRQELSAIGVTVVTSAELITAIGAPARP